MGAVKALPRRPLTRADLETMPDDGHRYELIDGTLVVSPAPAWGHQAVQGRLFSLLYAVCPSDLRVISAPFEVRLALSTAVQPDIVVARFADIAPKPLRVAPLLAVEIRSPSTALVDLNLKRAVYERYGIPSYWLLDPDDTAPALTVLELEDGCYVERATVKADETVDVHAPFPFRLCPDDLIRDLRAR
jgi:Uma2 family endonuclease